MAIKNGKFKKILIHVLCIITVLQAVYSTFSYTASVDYYSSLGTQEALNSPILNNQFSTDNWNKWEMVVWGIYLSNFAQPFIDTYETAFSSSSNSGSKGAGYAALVFGGASDAGSEETIQSLLQFAIGQQKGDYEKQIYVTFSDLNSDGTIDRHDPQVSVPTVTEPAEGEDGETTEDLSSISDSTVNLTPALVSDLFFGMDDSSATFADYGADSKGLFNTPNNLVDTGDGLDIAMCKSGRLPTFWVESGTRYEKVFDYTDAWDPQIFAATLLKSVSGTSNDMVADKLDVNVTANTYTDQVIKAIDEAFDQQYNLVMDAFGNICAKTPEGKKIVVPAASNQHLTNDESINLLTSAVFNGYMASVTENQLINSARQTGNGGIFGVLGSDNIQYGGLPAFGGSDSSLNSSTILCYYDLDTVMVQNHINNGSAKTSGGIHYGKAVKQLFDCDITKPLGNDYTLKIEALNGNKIADKIGPNKSIAFVKSSVTLHTVNVASMLANQLDNNSTRANVLSEMTDTDGTKISMFTEPVLIPVQAALGSEISEESAGKTPATAYRFFAKHLYRVYKQGMSNTYVSVNADDLENAFSESSENKFAESIMLSNNKLSDFGVSFVTNYKGTLYNIKGSTSNWKLGKVKMDADNIVPVEVGSGANSVKAKFNTKKTKASNSVPGRLVLAYPVSEVMRAANNYLGLKEGSEYSAYASKIYMTYLDWYGIDGTGDDATSKLNEKIYDDTVTPDQDAISEIIEGSKTQEEKEKEILDMTYLMLHPTEGREYRTTLVKNNLADFLYSQYQTVVYGESVSYNSGNLTTTKSSGGFLNIETLSENTFTKPFVDNYVDIVATIIVVTLVIIVVIGMLRGRKMSWFFISFIVAINSLLLVPSTGDIVPYLANKMMQSMFSDNMTFWALSEAIENAELEADVVSSDSSAYLSGLTEDEKSQVNKIVKSLNAVNLDRSLVLKRDISSKVNQTLSGNYAEIQNLRSARWLLPMIMRQYTAEDGSADYVSIPLGDMYDDLSNLYWAYKPHDAETVKSLTSEQQFQFDDSIISNLRDTNNRKMYYSNWEDISTKNLVDVDYKNESYTTLTASEVEHTYMYMLANAGVSVNSLSEYVDTQGGYENLSSLDGYSEWVMQINPYITNTMQSLAKTIESEASTYDRTDRTTVKQSFGYLWTTETPYHYFYGVCKDTFGAADSVDNPLTMASIIGKIQGEYVVNDNGDEVRTNFMYADETGHIKDVLDLEDLFTNCIPYMYQMQLLAGGDDGHGGTLEGVQISDTYSLYEGTDAAWLFRSNWVTKIIENPSYGDAETVKDKDGNSYVIPNPTLEFTYPDERPMVFSEAQMHDMGLKESDLNLVELKCIEINKNVSRRWTMLLNYANTSGMTREVLLRQMTTEAVLEFNSELSPTGIISGTYAMYPNSLDLRALSFDSVMRMLLLNITKNTGYIHSDTMLNVISNMDLFSAILLWIAAGMCSYIIPLGRRILMAAIFYIGILSMFYSMLSSNQYKTKKACAQLIINLAFLFGTMIYYLFFKLLMGITATDSVLTVSSVQVNAGNPLWCFILIIVASVIYLLYMVYIFKFCFLNFKDMGIEVMSAVAGTVTSKVSGAVGNVMNNINTFFNPDEGGSGASANLKGTGNNANSVQDVAITENRTNAQEVRIKDEDESSSYTEDYGKSVVYNEGISGNNDSSKFDREIEKGRNMGD